MAASKRQLILEEFRRRLRAIKTEAGFDTNCGDTVMLGFSPELGPDDPDQAIAILSGEDALAWHGQNIHVKWPIEVHALAKVDLDEPWIAIEQVVSDIKRAVELEDRRLGRLVKPFLERVSVRTLPREPGSTTAGAAVTYLVPLTEAWGDPA